MQVLGTISHRHVQPAGGVQRAMWDICRHSWAFGDRHFCERFEMMDFYMMGLWNSGEADLGSCR
jgi:hypothetical protein